jgi:hypothetical protein
VTRHNSNAKPQGELYQTLKRSKRELPTAAETGHVLKPETVASMIASGRSSTPVISRRGAFALAQTRREGTSAGTERPGSAATNADAREERHVDRRGEGNDRKHDERAPRRGAHRRTRRCQVSRVSRSRNGSDVPDHWITSSVEALIRMRKIEESNLTVVNPRSGKPARSSSRSSTAEDAAA